MADRVSDAPELRRIAAALEELVRLEHERRDEEREARAARRKPREKRGDRSPSPAARSTGAAVLRKLGVR